MFIRRLEIEDDKQGDRQIVYSIRGIEAKKGLSKAMAFIVQKEGNKGSISFLEFLKKDFEALGRGFIEIDKKLLGK